MKKFNWGTGIVLAFVLFISFILYFVIKTSTDTTYEYDLVAKDYYKNELEYQKRIDKLNNSKNLIENINLEKTKTGMVINFPKDIDLKNIKGTIYLYRPSNEVLDQKISIELETHSLFISEEILIAGRWDIQVDWSIEEEDYLFIHSINY